MSGASPFVGNYVNDQINATDVYSTSAMSSTSTHTCYPNGYPSSSTDEFLSIEGIIGVSVGGFVAVVILIVGYYLHSIGYFSKATIHAKQIEGEDVIGKSEEELSSNLELQELESEI